MELRSHIAYLEKMCIEIGSGENSIDELRQYLSVINKDIELILNYAESEENDFEINQQFVVQVLRDVLYGIEHRDCVYLLDAVKYGLLQIYYYADEEIGES